MPEFQQTYTKLGSLEIMTIYRNSPICHDVAQGSKVCKASVTLVGTFANENAANFACVNAALKIAGASLFKTFFSQRDSIIKHSEKLQDGFKNFIF